MSVKKIVYVTPGESELSELTSMAEHQLRKVANNVLEGDHTNGFKTFRTINESGILDSLLYLSRHCKNIALGTEEAIFNNILKNPADINEVINSTKHGEIVVVGVKQDGLKNILEDLKANRYDVIDRKIIKHPYNIYAVTIDVDSKKSDFFTATWGEE